MPGRTGGRQKPYQFIDSLVSLGAVELQKLGVVEAQGKEAMLTIAYALCDLYGRQSFYVPAVMERELLKRDLDIWQAYQQHSATAKAFTSARVAEIAQAHHLTVAQIYNILKLMRRREWVDRQGRLPGLDTEVTT